MRRLEDTVVGKDKGEDESDKNAQKLLPSIVGKSVNGDFLFFWNNAQIKGISLCFVEINCSAFKTFVRQLEKYWRDIQTLRLTHFTNECDVFGLSESTQELIICVDKLLFEARI